MHRSQRCYGELVELTVDDFWQMQMLAIRNFGDWHTVVDEVPWSSVPKTTMDWRTTSSTGVVQPLRNADRRRCCVNVE